MDQHPILWAAFDKNNTFLRAVTDPSTFESSTDTSTKIAALCRYVPLVIRGTCVSFDLDGILAINQRRAAIIAAEGDLRTCSWGRVTEIMSSVGHDDPGPLLQLAVLLGRAGVPVFVVSSRPESVRKQTEAWLAAHDCKIVEIYLRKEYQHKLRGSEVKRSTLISLAKNSSNIIHIDDDPNMSLLYIERVSVLVFPSEMPK